MVFAKKFVYVKPFKGMPTSANFKIVEEELPTLKDGEFLSQSTYISVDPYQRAYSARQQIGDTMMGIQIAKITETKSAKYPVGKYVVGSFGWRTHTISSEFVKGDQTSFAPIIIPYDGSVPLSLFLGVLGVTGNSAYFGLLEICKPKAGETVVVSGAAGAVGNHVGQIAKIKGCTVIGIAGSDTKCNWLKTLGFDHAINYKKVNLAVALKEAAPNGVDCYFDNVGGEISTTIIDQMNRLGRISACGNISAYNELERPKVTSPQWSIISNNLEMRGFTVNLWEDRWSEAILQNMQWIQEGKLKYRETVTEGFENTLDALIGILQGDNTGKAVVKIL